MSKKTPPKASVPAALPNIEPVAMPSYQNSKRKEIYDIITGFLLLATLLIGAGGLYIANDALNTYKSLNEVSKKLNEITSEGNLLGYDREINRQLREKPYLQSIYAVMPNNLKIKEKANLLVNNCLENDKQVINWIDIPDLYNKIWGYKNYKDFHNKNNYRLREFYNYLEDLLNLIMNVAVYHDAKIISDVSWSTYEGYLNEIGTHPIFLCVIHGGCEQGYIDKKFAEQLKEIIKRKHGEDTLRILYKEMLETDWYELNKKKRK
jgi:hypothetical protein